MTQFRTTLLAGAAALGLAVAPVAAFADAVVVTGTTSGTSAAGNTYYDPATGAVTTTTVTTTTIVGVRANIADPISWLEEKGYSNVEQVPGVTLESQIAFHAANGMGEPVEIVMDKQTGEVVRETYLRKVDTPSKQ